MSGIPAPKRTSLAPRSESPALRSAGGATSPTSSPEVASRLAASTSRLQPRRSMLGLAGGRTSHDARAPSPNFGAAPPSSQLSPPRATALRSSVGASLASKSSISSLGVAASAAAAGGIPKTPRRSLALGASTTTTTTTIPDSLPSASRSAPRKSAVGFAATVAPPPPLPSSTSRSQAEIGDAVRFDNGPQSLEGVVRFLGTIEGKAGYWAGLELTGDSSGKGKNDGTVAGVQYFACRPLDGVFCPAHKLVLLSSTPSADAVPRPHSAMSSRSGRESSMSLRGAVGQDEADIPSTGLPSRTPARKRSGTHQGPPSAFPGMTPAGATRPASRTSGRMTPTALTGSSRPTSALSHASTSSVAGRPGSRLGPRKSVADLAADEEARRRAKSSAEAAEEAEKRITKGSRADRLRNMRADELLAARRAGASNGGATSSASETATGISARPRPSSPTKGRPSSPLKETLLASNRPRSSMGAALTTGGGVTKGRASMAGSGALGAGGLPTPKTAQGRASMFGRPPSSLGSSAVPDMPPPPLSPTKGGVAAATASTTDGSPSKEEMRRSWSGGNGRPASSLSSHEAEAFWNAPSTSAKLHRFSVGADVYAASASRDTAATGRWSPRTPSRRQSMSSANGDGADVQATIRKAKERTHAMLLQEMDLTPRKAAAAAAALGSGSPAEGGDEEANNTLVADAAGTHDEFVAEPVVALSVYEELNEELRVAREELEAARRMSEVERERGAAEARKEMDEEREVERLDEARRKKAHEESLEALRKEVEAAAKEKRKLGEEVEKAKGEAAKMVRERESKLEESERLVADLKETIEKGQREKGEEKEQEDGRIGAKDAEIAQLTARVRRIEEEFEKERRELLGQIDELKDAGEEAMTLMESTLREEQDHHRSQLEEVKIQAEKLILKAEQEKAAAMAAVSSSTSGRAGANGAAESAAEIDNQNLREQVAHLQGKVNSLEDEVAELQQTAEEDKESTTKRRDKLVENEAKLRAEVAKLKAEVNKVNHLLAESKTQVGELHEALQESRARLESERAELETLRAEAEHGLPNSASSSSARGDGEKSRLEAEVERLSGLLEGARSGRHEAQRQIELLKKEVADLGDLVEDLKAQLKSLESDLGGGTLSSNGKAKSSSGPGGDRPSSFMSTGASPNLSATSPGLGAWSGDRATPSPKRLSTASNASRRSRSSLSGASTLAPDQHKELSGLRSLVASTSEENARLKQEVLEARLALDDAKERLLALEAASGSAGAGADFDASSLQSRLQKLASEKVALEKRLRESEKELVSSRIKLQEAQQEINDLEALCESAVYRRDEREAESSQLQRRVEKLTREMERMRRTQEANKELRGIGSSIGNRDGSGAEGIGMGTGRETDGTRTDSDPASSSDPPSDPISDPASSSSRDGKEITATAARAEIPTASTSTSASPTATATAKAPPQQREPTNASGQKWCDDCEEYGDHDLEHCPMSELF